MDWGEYIKYFAGLLAIVNPIGSIPVFISLTADQSRRQRRRSAAVASASVVAVLFVSLITGEAVLNFFSISVDSFRVGGGILILLIAISMLHAQMSPAKQTEEEIEDAAAKDSVAVVPLGIPLLAGPGAISTVILYAHRDAGWEHYLILTGEIVLVAAIVWLALRAAPTLAGMLGRTGINVITRLMGLIMAAIGVEFMTNGLKQLLPGLG